MPAPRMTGAPSRPAKVVLGWPWPTMAVMYGPLTIVASPCTFPPLRSGRTM